MLLRFIQIIFLSGVVVLIGCKNSFDEGYRAGYEAASVRAESKIQDLQSELESCNDDLEEAQSNADGGDVTTEVCGGGGININGKYIPPGKSGCVRVYSDGTVKRY